VDFFGATELSSSEAGFGDVNGLRPDIFRRPTEHRPVTVRKSVSKWEFFSADVAATTNWTSEEIQPVPDLVTGHRAIAGRVVNEL